MSTRAERVSYGKWQEPVLAILKACHHRLKGLVMGSGKNWFSPFKSVSIQAERVSYGEWQEPVLAIFKVCRHRLNWVVMGTGKNRFLPVLSGKNQFLPFSRCVDTS